jgi:ketosteroid isomerase-like protein
MTLDDRIRRLEDIEEVRRLRNMYHHFVNENLPDRFREIYTDDGVIQIDTHMKFVGIEAIVEGFRKIPARTPLVKQFVHSHQVDVAGDTTTAFAYIEARYAQDGQSLMVAGRYDETYVRTSAGWRITTTYAKVDFAVPVQTGWAGENLDYFSREKLANW